jgi:hypothetical protein
MQISTFTFRFMRNISLAQSANITLTKSKYHISPQAKYITAMLATISCNIATLWGLVKFHIGGKVREHEAEQVKFLYRRL